MARKYQFKRKVNKVFVKAGSLKIKVCPAGCKAHKEHVYMSRDMIKKYEQMLSDHEIARFYPVLIDRWEPRTMVPIYENI